MKPYCPTSVLVILLTAFPLVEGRGAAPIAECGFNDTSGINASPTSGMPYSNGVTVVDRGATEPGWTATWASWPADPPFTACGAATQEGDLALRIYNDHASYGYSVWREYTDQTNSFYLDLYVQIKRMQEQVFTIYTGPHSTDVGGPAIQASVIWFTPNGMIYAKDGNGSGGGTDENTGFSWSTSSWVRVTQKIDVATESYEVWIDEQYYAAPDPLGFRHTCSLVDDVRFLFAASSTQDQEAFVDAIRVQTENPLPLDITSLQGNGSLSWTHSATTGYHTVEWAASLTGVWNRSWTDLVNLSATGGPTTVQVPMFYRVMWTAEQVSE